MKNGIRTKEGKGWKVWSRRSKKLKSGEINCPRCGEWKEIKRFTDKHFTEDYICGRCKKELRKLNPPEPKERKVPKPKATFPMDCKHKWFFRCKTPSRCVGCYYHPVRKIAMMTRHEDDDPKPRSLWFYADKRHVKDSLKMLEDIKYGRGKYKLKH